MLNNNDGDWMFSLRLFMLRSLTSFEIRAQLKRLQKFYLQFPNQQRKMVEYGIISQSIRMMEKDIKAPKGNG